MEVVSDKLLTQFCADGAETDSVLTGCFSVVVVHRVIAQLPQQISTIELLNVQYYTLPMLHRTGTQFKLVSRSKDITFLAPSAL